MRASQITLLELLRNYAQQKRQLPLGFIAGVVQQIAEGLHYAHELRDRNGELMGVVHRDVTPSNLFLTESFQTELTYEELEAVHCRQARATRRLTA